MQEVQAILAVAPNPRARLLMLLQWRAGLRVSEALALESADLSPDSDQPTIRVRQGNGGRSRIVPVHPELLNSLADVLQFSQTCREQNHPGQPLHRLAVGPSRREDGRSPGGRGARVGNSGEVRMRGLCPLAYARPIK